jgi:murein DD-endopeptidase MepM/ murein hydrolase activator NlpD
MKKEKFVYNRHTLQYEKVSLSLSQKTLRIGALVAGVVAYTMLVWTLLPKGNNFQARENRLLKEQLLSMSQELDNMSAALDNLKERDNNLYRNVLNMNPLDAGVWNGGRGGSIKHAELAQLSDNELVVKIHQKLAQNKNRMAILAKSQDEIMASSSSKEDKMQAIPSIRPIQVTERSMHQLSGFGMRLHPILKTPHMHTGIDFGAPTGTPIHATGNATVIRVEYKTTGYGYNVVLDHGYGYQTLYGHMSKIDVKVGQKVKRGEVLGLVGNTGLSTAPHVHYEVFLGGNRIDPMPYCMDMSPSEYKQFIQAVSAQNSSAD